MIAPWARNAMTLEAQTIARGLGLSVTGKSPKGPWTIQCPGHRWEGGDVNALVLKAAKELSDAR